MCKQDPNDLIERVISCISSSFSQTSGNDEDNVRSGLQLFNDFSAEITRQHTIQLRSLTNTENKTNGVAFILAAATIITEASNDTVSRFKKQSKVVSKPKVTPLAIRPSPFQHYQVLWSTSFPRTMQYLFCGERHSYWFTSGGFGSLL